MNSKYRVARKKSLTPYKNEHEKALRETQTLRAGCSKGEPKIFAPPQTSFPGRGTANIQSAGDGHYLYLQTLFLRIGARNFELSW